jgi:hypothetical protein
VLFPINWGTWLGADFGPQVVARAEAQGAARLALKALAWGALADGEAKRYAKCWYRPIDDPELASLALRFSLSQSITAAIPPGEAPLFRRAMDIADRFTPITPAEVEILRGRATERAPLFRLAAA